MAKPNVPGYVLADKIGGGTFADVYKAYSRIESRQVVAIKCIRKGNLSATLADSIVTEISLLKQLKHPYIVQMKEFIWDKEYIFVIMEYCSGGDLSTFIRSRQHLPENVCRRFLQQLSLALEYLRSHNVAHMDLKPQNLLLSSKTCPLLKIADFGLAKTLGSRDTDNVLRGSPLYMAPEILLNKHYTASVDLWSVGVILYECLFGRAPYSSKSLGELIDKIKNGAPIKIPADVKISPECHDLLTKLLKRNPEERITFEDFFRHPFLDRVSTANPRNRQKAAALIARAKEEESKGKIEAALQLYCEAMQLYIPLIQHQAESEEKSRFQEEVDRYIGHAEELKAVLQTTPVSSKPRSPHSSDSFRELFQLSSSTPCLKSALEIGVAAAQYEAEGQFPAALERYQMALEQLLNLLRNEPKGRRKELLLQQVNIWMSHAEKIKSCVESHQVPFATDPALEYSRCVIQ